MDNSNKTQISYELAAFVKAGYKMDDLIALKPILGEDFIIKRLSEQEDDPVVNQFLREYYDQYIVNDNRVLVISDTHLGSKYGTYELLNNIYELAEKNNIKYIIHAGDIIEGFANMTESHKMVEEQIAELQEKYPRSSSIKTYYILGNHDYLHNRDTEYDREYSSYLVRDTLNAIPNMVCAGTLQSFINFNGEHRIKLFHTDGYGLSWPNLEHDLTLAGHSHAFKVYENDSLVKLPALLKDNIGSFIDRGFIELTLEEDGYLIKSYLGASNNKVKTLEKKINYPKC